MNELVNVLGQQQGLQHFDEIRISIASAERIRSWSYGEIKKPETMVYFVLEFLDRLKIMSACAVNINA
jgi:hypothetical protein